VGFAYGGGKWYETAPLHGRRAMLSFTLGASPDRFEREALFGPLDHYLQALHRGTFMFCRLRGLGAEHLLVPGQRRAGAPRRIPGGLATAPARARPGTPLPFVRAADFTKPKV